MLLELFAKLCRQFLPVLFIFLNFKLHAQCSPQTGAPPSGAFFVTAQHNSGGVDTKWKIARDSINGTYVSAIVMKPLPQQYHNNTAWISFSPDGEHTSNSYFFYQLNFDLPCNNLCGKSFSEDSSFCLNLDLYTDNSVSEIFVNGKPQSGNSVGIISFADPFNPNGHAPDDRTAVSLCKDWKAGSNSIIIKVASSATVAGLMVEASTNNNTDTIVAAICEGESYLGYTESGIYLHKYRASNGCDSTRIIKLKVQATPEPDLGEDTGICNGDSMQLYPGEFTSYLWSDGSTNERYTIGMPGTYSVTVSNGCYAGWNEITIKDGACDVYFPNAFTPNGDGKNESFKILTDLLLPGYHLTIYNRWGQKVFETNNPSKSWDGTWNGKVQPIGVFVWYCTFKKSGIQTALKGSVALLK
jgi:gliding motility-associated-like protein